MNTTVDLKRRPSVAESVQSANSSGHLFPVEIRQSQQEKPTPRTNPTSIFEVDNSPIPSLGSYLKTLITDMSSADILLAVMEPGEGQESTLVHAHSIVLSRLPFFRRLIADHKAIGKSPIIVPHALSVCILRQLLVYAYTDSVKEATANLSPNMLRQLQKAASNCSMPDLCKACMNKLSGQESSESSSAKAPGGGPTSPTVRRRISRGSSLNQARMDRGSSDRNLPVLLSKKSSLSDSSPGGSLKLKQLSSKHFEPLKAAGGNSDAGSSGRLICMESGSSMSSSPVDGRDGGDEQHRQQSAVRLSSGSLRAFAEEMAELRRLLLTHPRGNGQEIPKKATELLEDLQSSMMETIRSEFRGCLKEAQDKGEPSGSLSSLASGITCQIHNLRDDLISMLNTTDGRVPSTSPTRSAVHVREESPVNSVVPTAGVQPVPLRLSPNLSAEPVVRAAQFDRQAVTPPLAPRPLTSVLAGTPGAPGRLGKPFQRLVVHASTGQLPGQVARSPSPNSSPCHYAVPGFSQARPQTRSVSPIPSNSIWHANGMSGARRPGWGAAPGPTVSVRFNRSPRPIGSSGASTITTNRSWHNLQEPVTANPKASTTLASGQPEVETTKAANKEKAPVETLRL